MKSLPIALAAVVLVTVGAGCGGTTGLGFYGTTGYAGPLYADPFWPPGAPYSYYYPYRFGLGPRLYTGPFYYPPTFFSPYRPYPYRYGWRGPRRFSRR
ncbi:hypothetical protein [Candidatus Nitrospira bockiana]